jgi:hypothetical protein
MKKHHTSLIDILLFIGFLALFFLDLTGLVAHQWLGIFIGFLAFYHTLKHLRWLSAVAQRFLYNTTWRSRLYLLIDVTILLGFATILVTGLAMSTWFDLPLSHYRVWKGVHVAGSLLTLALVVLKLLLHWRWIAHEIRKAFRSKLPACNNNQQVKVSEMLVASKDRRDFLRLLLFLGTASAAAAVVSTTGKLTSLLPADSEIAGSGQSITGTASLTPFQPTSSSTVQPVSQPALNTATPTQPSMPTATTVPCTVLCNRGCYYPGLCRRYIDRNNNGRCDNGECL